MRQSSTARRLEEAERRRDVISSLPPFRCWDEWEMMLQSYDKGPSEALCEVGSGDSDTSAHGIKNTGHWPKISPEEELTLRVDRCRGTPVLRVCFTGPKFKNCRRMGDGPWQGHGCAFAKALSALLFVRLCM
jgi:hypothetical protein